MTRLTRAAATLGTAAFLAIVAAASPSAAPERIRIVLATSAPRDTSYHHILLEMRDAWRTASGGRVELVIHTGGSQGSEAEVVRRMNINQLNAALLTAGGVAEIDPSVAAL